MHKLGKFSMLNAQIPSNKGAMSEMALVGAAGTNFETTENLKVLNYKQSMASPLADLYQEGIFEEHERFVQEGREVWEPIPEDEVPPGTVMMDGTWANKFKANGDVCCRLNARGFKQIDGLHCDKDETGGPVTQRKLT